MGTYWLLLLNHIRHPDPGIWLLMLPANMSAVRSLTSGMRCLAATAWSQSGMLANLPLQPTT